MGDISRFSLRFCRVGDPGVRATAAARALKVAGQTDITPLLGAKPKTAKGRAVASRNHVVSWLIPQPPTCSSAGPGLAIDRPLEGSAMARIRIGLAGCGF